MTEYFDLSGLHTDLYVVVYAMRQKAQLIRIQCYTHPSHHALRVYEALIWLATLLSMAWYKIKPCVYTENMQFPLINYFFLACFTMCKYGHLTYLRHNTNSFTTIKSFILIYTSLKMMAFYTRQAVNIFGQTMVYKRVLICHQIAWSLVLRIIMITLVFLRLAGYHKNTVRNMCNTGLSIIFVLKANSTKRH